MKSFWKLLLFLPFILGLLYYSSPSMKLGAKAYLFVSLRLPPLRPFAVENTDDDG